MGRKSSIDKLDPAVRSHIEKRLRERRLTLDELIEDLHQHFPSEDKPSRSAIGRYKVSFGEMTQRLREQQNMASLLVEELGENPDDKAGALMVQSITTLTTHMSMGAQVDEETTVDDVRKLARAAKDVLQARKLSRDERHAIQKEAREALLQEQEQRLEEMRGSDGMSEQFEERIKRVLLGKA
ncbi:phage protein Gp27 family protein [uncultured Pseudomonas sp.]|uniref:phage protein Gp27 family protein n=1 Tax=uncultured Pseudomonas sp. TaxID=114707 RepID=UPI0030DC33F7|tara:strand:+ start:32077 stop:32625 length:549 start_codon:yes stop_codon:yes gene_type:complete